MIFSISMLLAALIFRGYAAEETSWQGSLPEGFSSTISVSSSDISIGDKLTIETALTYPTSYQPEPDAMIQQLLSYGGFDAPPFYLVQRDIGQPVKAPQQGQDLTSLKFSVVLAPQLPGKHYIAFQTIPFTAEADSGKSKEIIPGLFEINVHIPKDNFQSAFLITPPMPLSQDLPVTISAANRLQFIENEQEISKASAQTLDIIHSKKLPWQIVPALWTN
jgi:hypothetical protein